MKPPPLGSINARAPARARIGRNPFVFDSTTLGLVRMALANGAKAGTIVWANFGLGERAYRIVAAPHDDRAGGYWAERAEG